MLVQLTDKPLWIHRIDFHQKQRHPREKNFQEKLEDVEAKQNRQKPKSDRKLSSIY